MKETILLLCMLFCHIGCLYTFSCIAAKIEEKRATKIRQTPEYRRDTFRLAHYEQIEIPAGNDEGYFETKEVQQEDSKSNIESECIDYSEQEKYIKKLEFMLKSSGTPILDIEHAEKIIKEIEELGNKEHAIHLNKKAWVRTEDVINIIHKYFS